MDSIILKLRLRGRAILMGIVLVVLLVGSVFLCILSNRYWSAQVVSTSAALFGALAMAAAAVVAAGAWGVLSQRNERTASAVGPTRL